MPLRIVSHLSVNAALRDRLIRERLIFLKDLVRPAGLEPATSWFVAISRPLRTNMHTRRWSNIDGHKRTKDRGVGMTPNHMV